MTRAEFNDAADTYCALFSASSTSGRRTRHHNAAVGGVPNSAHLYGLGLDVIPDSNPEPAAASEAARRLGLRLIIESDHHHLQPLDWRAG